MPPRDRLRRPARARARTIAVGARDELGSVRDRAAPCGRRAAARSPRRRARRSPGRGRRSARRGRRAGRRAGTRARARSVAAARPRAAGRRPRRRSRSRPAARETKLVGAGERGGRAHALVAGGRVAEPDVVGDRPAEERRMLRHPGRRAAATRSGRRPRGRRRRRGSARPSGSARRGAATRRVLFPPPLGPTSATVSPGASSRSTPAQHVDLARAGSGTTRPRTDRRERGLGRRRPPCRHAPRGTSTQIEQPLRDGRAVGARVELRREVPQRQVQLGREHEHGQRRLEADAARREPHADDDGDERDPERRGELEHRAGEERDPQRAHRRPAVLVAHLGDRAPPAPAPRLNARSVGSPRTTSRKWFESSASACQRSRARRSVWRPTSHMKTGTSGSVRSMTPAASEVDRRDEHEHGDRHDARRGRPAGGSGRTSSPARRRPCTAAVATSALSAPSSAAGCRRSRASTSVEPQLGEHARRGPPPDDLEAPGRARPRRDDERRAGRRAGRDLRERRAVERARGDAREQHRLREHEQRRDDAERRVDRRAARAPPARGGGGAGRGGASAGCTPASGYGAGSASTATCGSVVPAPRRCAEDVVRPALVQEDERDEDQRDDAHDLQRVVRRRRRRRR